MKNIFVSNLSFRLKNEDLQALFEEFGEVSSAKIINDKISGRSRGFGFVEMPDDDSAVEAINALNDRDIDGKTISVSEANPREPRSNNNNYSRRPQGNNNRFGKRNNGGGGGGGYNRNNRY